jgi:hypothetical protein
MFIIMHTRSPTLNSKLQKHTHTKTSFYLPPSKKNKLPPIDTNLHTPNLLSPDWHYTKSPQSKPIPEESKKRQKDFLEMMGFSERSPVSSLHSPLSVGENSPKISITDLMGTKKFVFLKKTGFLPMYYECKRTQEHKKLVEEKNALSYANMIHTDLIRENNFKVTNRPPDSGVEFKRYKKRKKTTKKVLQIEEIFKQCDALTVSTKQTKKDIEIGFPVVGNEQRKAKRKLTSKDIKSIEINIHHLEQ